MAESDNIVQQLKITGRKPDEDLNLRPREEIEAMSLPTDVLLEEAAELASERMSGVLPTDVQQFVEQTTAEKGIIQGLGLGQASRFLTARDLGLTSLQLQDSGVKMATDLSEIANKDKALELQRQATNEEINIKMHELHQDQIEWYDRFAAQLAANKMDERQLAVSVSDILARSTATQVNVMSDMIIANSRDRIDNVSGDIAAIQEIFADQGYNILDLTGLL